MGLINLFKLEKLKIFVYNKVDRVGLHKTFEVMFNPESYSLSYENVYSKKQGINTSGRTEKYSLSKPSKLSLKLIIDGTGVSYMGITDLVKMIKGKNDVYKSVQEFLTLTFHMDGKIHEPKYLKVTWGDLEFDCRLQKVDVNYTLFDKGGKPLRAELDTEFIGDIKESKRLKKENKNSPDLTHTRIVKEHDTLPLLCEEIYGSPKYYIKVASANRLKDFRNLEPGRELFFPPIKN